MRLRAKCLVFLVFLLQSCYSVNSNYSLNKLKYGLSEEEIRKNVFSCEPAEKNIVDETKVVSQYYRIIDKTLEAYIDNKNEV